MKERLSQNSFFDLNKISFIVFTCSRHAPNCHLFDALHHHILQSSWSNIMEAVLATSQLGAQLLGLINCGLKFYQEMKKAEEDVPELKSQVDEFFKVCEQLLFLMLVL